MVAEAPPLAAYIGQTHRDSLWDPGSPNGHQDCHQWGRWWGELGYLKCANCHICITNLIDSSNQNIIDQRAVMKKIKQTARGVF